MIKFFRNLPRRQAGIRKNLLNEGKSTKPASPSGRYFKYAIGEILKCPVRDNLRVAIFIKHNPRAVRYEI
ncbi:MAG: hypothetical protein CVT96_07020 [Bacteroidetes bacterium HGW-Bacteroidetes-13]|nr:MAG: hypothetical protein CVT96_07020 [Bacteroidetes bacterium HGW-Bacteroidetes-13]